jgi:hypothetical protein
MSRLVRLQTEYGSILIESSEGEGQGTVRLAGGTIDKKKKIEDLIREINPLSELIIGSVHKLSKKPDSINAEFGLNLNFEGNLYVVKASAEATIKVTTVGSDIDKSGGTIYTSPDGFRLQVPSGWVMWDGDNTMPGAVSSEKSQGLGMLAELCPQTGAMPQIGGGYVCSPSEEQSRVSIFRYANLTSRPEFASIVSSDQNITISDLVALWIQQSTTEGQNVSRHEVTENEERAVNLFDATTNRTLEGITAPARWVQLAVSQQSEGLFQTVEVTYSALLVLSPDGKTGYAIIPTGRYSGDERPAGTEEIVNSFELIVPSSITPTTPSTVSPPQQQQQQPPSPPAPQLFL